MPGTAMPKIIPMIPTTTINSIKVKADCMANLFLILILLLVLISLRGSDDRVGLRLRAKLANIGLFADGRCNREHRRKHAEQETAYPNGHNNNHGRLDQIGHDPELQAQL